MNPRDLFAAAAFHMLGMRMQNGDELDKALRSDTLIQAAWNLSDRMVSERQKRRKEQGPICCPRCAHDLREPDEAP